jgi:hypothetical protein
MDSWLIGIGGSLDCVAVQPIAGGTAGMVRRGARFGISAIKQFGSEARRPVTLTADPRSVAAEPANSAANDAGFAVPPPSTPAPMFPAGPSLAAAGDMIGFSRELAGGSQAITLISASRRWMAVYHVDQAGQIRLVSSRPLDADFSFQFNATAPLPEEIRRLQGG